MRIVIDQHLTLDVLLLISPKDQARGFQNVDVEPTDRTGMLFLYRRPKSGLSFWMKDVKFDLDLLAFDENGVLIQATRLKAGDESSVPVKDEATCVLETKAGFANRHGLKLGKSTIKFDV